MAGLKIVNRGEERMLSGSITGKIMPKRKMTAMILAALALSASPAALAQSSQSDTIIDLGGESTTSKSIVLPLNKAAMVQLPRGAADVIVAQPEMVDAVVRTPRRVFLLGQTVGQTNAFFFDAQGRQILNLEIRVERDLDALEDLIARLMPSSRITAEAVNDNIILRGAVNSSVEAANARDIAGRFLDDPDKVVPMLEIRQREQVMLKVRIVEMQRSIAKNLGIDLSGVAALTQSTIEAAATNLTAGTAGLALSATRNIGSNGSTITGLLQALETVGIVRTLAEPTLTAVSGESANFLAGGEFPIPIGQRDGVISLEFRQFGVSLGFTPLVLNKGRINIKVSTEVSEVTAANNFTINGSSFTTPGTPPPPDQVETADRDGDGFTDDANNVTDFLVSQGLIDRPQGTPPSTLVTGGLTVPAFTVRRAETTVELPSGGSLVLGGLLQENMLQTVNGLPFLRDVPVLGQLFRSREYQNSETELVIIATPYLVDPTHESKLADPSKGFVAASDMQSIITGKIVATYGLASAGIEEKTLQGPIGFILD